MSLSLFDGATFSPELDGARLSSQLVRVKYALQAYPGAWRSLEELSTMTGDPPASISARLRDLRKFRFGLYTIERRRRSRGLFEYRIA